MFYENRSKLGGLSLRRIWMGICILCDLRMLLVSGDSLQQQSRLKKNYNLHRILNQSELQSEYVTGKFRDTLNKQGQNLDAPITLNQTGKPVEHWDHLNLGAF